MAAMNDVPVQAPSDIGAHAAAQVSQAGGLFSLGEFQLTIVIFVFGLISLVAFLMMVRGEKATPYMMRLYVIIILVFGTLLVVSSSYSTEQIAPVVGFFGTIAGYLLGRTDRVGSKDEA